MADYELLGKLNGIKQRFDEITDLIIQPDVISDQKRYAKLNKEYSDLKEIVNKQIEYENLINNLKEAEEIINDGNDAEMVELAKIVKDEALNQLQAYEVVYKFLHHYKDTYLNIM